VFIIYIFSGRSGEGFTLDMLANHGITSETGMPPFSSHTVTVPGAAAGWVDTVENFGSGKVCVINKLQYGGSGYPMMATGFQRSRGLLRFLLGDFHGEKADN
jgi:gamma-glutamyltranspeptidase